MKKDGEESTRLSRLMHSKMEGKKLKQEDLMALEMERHARNLNNIVQDALRIIKTDIEEFKQQTNQTIDMMKSNVRMVENLTKISPWLIFTIVVLSMASLAGINWYLGKMNMETQNSQMFLEMGLEASVHQGEPIILVHPKNAQVIPCVLGKKTVQCIVRK